MPESIYFQMAPHLTGVVTPQCGRDTVEALNEEKTRQALSIAGSLAATAQEALKTAPVSKVTLEFGIQVGGEAGIPLVTKGSVGAHFTVTVELENPGGRGDG